MNHFKRRLAWKLNWYRHSELEGAMLLGRALRAATDPALIRCLTRHCADEARHSLLWSETIHGLNLPFVRIFRSYQSFYAEDGVMPSTLAEVLALTHVFEHRVDAAFRVELRDPELPRAAAVTFQRLIEDERDHLHWIARWLADRPETEPLLRRFEAADRDVYARLARYQDRPWEIPGLGEELDCGSAEVNSGVEALARM